MSGPPPPSRFAPSSKTTHERLSSNTVGLVALSDFRKRRAEVIEQQEREAREAAYSTPPDRSQTGTPDNNNVGSDDGGSASVPLKPARKKKKKLGTTKLSFADDEDGEDSTDAVVGGGKRSAVADGESSGTDSVALAPKGPKIQANKSVAIVPKAVTKAALRREAAEREALRREFLVMQEAVKATEIAIPFVFYDGSNIPGGVVRVKKGDFVWIFLDKSRKVGAELGVGEKANARKEWARVSVDDLLLVRGTLIIPHHYDFYFFIINKCIGPGGQRLFDYSVEAPAKPAAAPAAANEAANDQGVLKLPSSKAAPGPPLPDIMSLEGANADATITKVVDRRWYERNKHIYPASAWQEFDPEKDYTTEIRRDTGGNAFFFAK